MVIKGAARRNAAWWTRHLLKDKENDRVSLVETRGLIASDLNSMMQEMKQYASLSGNCKNFMYIASFNPQAHEHHSEEQWERMLEIFEKERGIPANQPRIVVEHEKKGRTHRHVIWQRMDLETMRAFADGLNPKICQQAAQKIELELGLERTPKSIEPEKDRPKTQGPKSWEMYRGLKTGIDPREVQAEATALLQQSKNGQDFKVALERHGYELANGNRGLLILDGAGKEHSLARRCGLKAAELNAFMREVDRDALPTVEEAKAARQERKIAQLEADRATVSREIAWEEKLAQAAIEKEKIERQFVEPDHFAQNGADGKADQRREYIAAPPELVGTAAHIREARERSDNARAFVAALAERGIGLAQATKADAVQSQLENAEAKLAGRWKPTFREGEIVAVAKEGQVWKLTARTTGDKDQREIQKFLGELDKPLPSILEAQHRREREQDLEELKPCGRFAFGPRGQGMVEQQAWAMNRMRATDEYTRKEEERRAEEAKNKSAGEVDPHRYLADPEYRRQVKAERAYQTPAERKAARENEARTMLEQQGRQR
jgi:hypothetical protein